MSPASEFHMGVVGKFRGVAFPRQPYQVIRFRGNEKALKLLVTPGTRIHQPMNGGRVKCDEPIQPDYRRRIANTTAAFIELV